MSGRAAFVHDRSLEEYGFGEDHPFNPLRLRLTLSLCEELGLLEDYGFMSPDAASEEELLLVHGPDYIRTVQEASGDEGDRLELLQHGLGTPDNPLFPDMHGAASRVVGGTLHAARMVIGREAEHALCISGGLHHALRSKASGFCVYNDAAVAIARLLEEGPDLRIAYIDTDVHHGDGVQWAFYGDPRVLTISTHESGSYLFPGTGGVGEMGEGEGRGYSLNLPLEPGTGDESWVACLEELLPRALEAFRPDLIISQNGCDGHALDPLADLEATTRLYERVPRMVHDLAHEHCGGRWVVLGGGGYDHFRVVPRAWAALWAAVSHQDLPEEVPETWISGWQERSPVALPRSIGDGAEEYPDSHRRGEALRVNRQTLDRLLGEVLPLVC